MREVSKHYPQRRGTRPVLDVMAQPPFPCMVEALSPLHPVVKQEHQEGRERPERLGIEGRLVGELVVRGSRGHHPSGNPQTETGLVHDGDWELWVTWATCDDQFASVQGVEGIVNRYGQTYGIVTGVVTARCGHASG